MKKLKLESVDVQRFVTNLTDTEERRVQGGYTNTCEPTGPLACPTAPWCFISRQCTYGPCY